MPRSCRLSTSAVSTIVEINSDTHRVNVADNFLRNSFASILFVETSVADHKTCI